MIFLDTCVWIELLGVRSPIKTHEKRQATAASELLETILTTKKKIITCKEQLIELVSAIEKVTMRTVNQERKKKNLPGIGNLKEFRQLNEFQNTKRLCETIVNDVTRFAEIHNIGNYDMSSIIQRLDLADINDCLYFDYCTKENVDFYTFDSDLKNLGNNRQLHCFLAAENKWS